ncbi:hypothetical protein HOF92_04670 [bacterium]|jgi:tetratricopeptide (TPR) repeat protein|nr:hypothetical protein [bacterium]
MLRSILKLTIFISAGATAWAGPNLDEIFTKLSQLTASISNPKKQETLQGRLVLVLGDAGRYAQAKEEAFKITEPIMQSKMLQYVAMNYALTLRHQEALEIVKKIPLSNYSIPIYLRIARVFHLIGVEGEVGSLLEKAKEEADSLGIPNWESSYLAEVAEAYAYCGEMDKALKIAVRLKVARDKAGTLAALSAYYENYGRDEDAAEVLQIAMEIAQKAYGAAEKADILMQITLGYEGVAQPPKDDEEILKSYRQEIYQELYRDEKNLD